MAPALGATLSAADRLGRGTDRRDAELLPATAPAPQAPEVDQPAQAAQRRNQAPYPCGAHLSEPGELPAIDPGAVCRDPRSVARRSPLSQHGVPEGAEERPAAVRGLNDQSLSHDSNFAQLDVHNPGAEDPDPSGRGADSQPAAADGRGESPGPLGQPHRTLRPTVGRTPASARSDHRPMPVASCHSRSLRLRTGAASRLLRILTDNCPPRHPRWVEAASDVAPEHQAPGPARCVVPDRARQQFDAERTIFGPRLDRIGQRVPGVVRE